jgi:hypothetical protein
MSEEDEQSRIMRMNGLSPAGFPLSPADDHDFSFHMDKEPGLIMEGIVFKECTNCDGESKYWKATAKIGSLFGQEVEGEIKGIGKTKEIALERLAKERKKLYDSLWA